jgi:hypothetical protein
MKLEVKFIFYYWNLDLQPAKGDFLQFRIARGFFQGKRLFLCAKRAEEGFFIYFFEGNQDEILQGKIILPQCFPYVPFPAEPEQEFQLENSREIGLAFEGFFREQMREFELLNGICQFGRKRNKAGFSGFFDYPVF